MTMHPSLHRRPKTVCTLFAAALMLLGMLGSASAATTTYGKCKVSGPRGIVKLKTITPNTLTLRPAIGDVGYFNGDSLSTIDSGFGYCLSAYIAYRAGLDHIKLVTESFAQMLAGQTNIFDIDISETTITPARAKVVAFTVPYTSVDEGLLVRAGTKVTDESVRDLRLGALRASTNVPFIEQQIRPTKPIKVFTDTASMFTALAADQVDGVFYDSGTVRSVAAKSGGRLVVAGIYPATAQELGGVLGKDSPNLAAFNTIIEGLKKDGTLQKLAEEYLVPAFGGISESQIPKLTAPFPQPK